MAKKQEKIDPVSPSGSLGLLALGYVGLMAWREKRRSFNAGKKKNKNES